MSKKQRKPSTYKGLPVVDAHNDVSITISRADVNRAKKMDPVNCAAALATSRKFNAGVEVHISRTYVKKKNKWFRFLTPESISREITSFDRSAQFEPVEYIIKAPTESQKLGNHRKSPEAKRRKNNKQHKTTNIRAGAK